MRVFLAVALLFVPLPFAARHARAAESSEPGALPPSEPQAPTPSAAPPPLTTDYLQYGVAFTAELIASTGAMCNRSNANVPCVLGSGGGIAARIGWRSRGPWYLGAAYELSKQDPNNLYRLAILQQLRLESRWYATTGLTTQPYATFGVGAVTYGNEWGVDTLGPSAFVGVGSESELSRNAVFGVVVVYRLMNFSTFTDTGGHLREFSFAHIVGIDLLLEARDSIGAQN